MIDVENNPTNLLIVAFDFALNIFKFFGLGCRNQLKISNQT
jgi:hypothetical protein